MGSVQVGGAMICKGMAAELKDHDRVAVTVELGTF